MARLLLVIVIVLVSIGLLAGGVSLMGGDTWSPRAYVPRAGDCFVPPQGDPLYDREYAQEINPYNCESLVDQSTARQMDAHTRQLNSETTIRNYGVAGFLGVMVLLVIGAVVVIIKG